MHRRTPTQAVWATAHSATTGAVMSRVMPKVSLVPATLQVPRPEAHEPCLTDMTCSQPQIRHTIEAIFGSAIRGRQGAKDAVSHPRWCPSLLSGLGLWAG